MFGRPELTLNIKLKPYGEIRDESMELPLIFFSAFERVALESDNKMQRMGNIIQLYKPGPLPALEPIMHVGFLSRVLCRVPVIPCFMYGSDHPTIPLRFARSSKINHLACRPTTRHRGWQQALRSEYVDVELWTRDAKASNCVRK